MDEGKNVGAEDLISVIVPVYNLEKYLPECIESIRNQTYGNLEIILVDDGSTDNSGTICDEYAGKDKRIKVKHKSNGGVSSARNCGLQLAKGSYIGFIDGDDKISANMYDLLYSSITEYKSDIAFGTMLRPGRQSNSGKRVQLLTDGEILDAFVDGGANPHIEKSVCDKLFRREIIGDTRFLEGKRSEDAQFTMVILSRCSSCVFAENAQYFYRMEREGNFTTTLNSNWFITDKIPVLLEQIEILKNVDRWDLAERQESVFYSEVLRFYLKISTSEKTEKNRDKNLRYLKDIIINKKKQIRSLYKTPYATWKYKLKMELFMVFPDFYTWLYRD